MTESVRLHTWQRHPKAVMSVCGSCGRHWYPEREQKPTDPCTGVREPAARLEKRFEVRKVNDPTGKHRECRYFVLDPQHDQHARRALLAYAESSEVEHPDLAADLYGWLANLAVTQGLLTLTDQAEVEQPIPTPRLRACVENWPDCETGDYHPSCCRFPKSCSCTVYDPDLVGPEDLEQS